jgi:ubiquinone/menaquinone biosynthesis C-methylase UbiE
MRRTIRALGLVLCALGLVPWALGLDAAQTSGVHPLSGRRYALTMGVAGADWLDRAERAREEDPDRALRAIRVQSGWVVADIGAGSGYWTERLSRAVGSTGRVYANDIQQGMLDILRRRIDRAKIGNVELVLGTQSDPRLPRDALDLAIMVDVYHEFSEPQAMLRRIREALKPDGRMVLLEYRGEDPSVPIRPEHKMTVAQAKLEVEAEGFTLATVNGDLPWQHILIFQRAR